MNILGGTRKQDMYRGGQSNLERVGQREKEIETEETERIEELVVKRESK
jgi:hypothetical protein